MFKKIKEKINQIVKSRKNNINAAQFNDDVATMTCWEALNTSTSNFDVRVLTLSSNGNDIKFKTTIVTKLFASVFIITGTGLLLLTDEWFPQIICIIFILFGVFFFYFASVPIEFRRMDSVFIKGWSGKKKVIAFSEIYALQLIPSYVSSSDGPDYHNYQINIVFKNGQRINIVTYYNKDKALYDAKIISDHIGRPLWNAL